ncbi:hypothetical protein ACLOJK_040628 [Asimina triloba]
MHYNARLRERLLRADDNELEDPLDLMSIGQYANLEAAQAQVGDNDHEDPLYEWLRTYDLDEKDGGSSHEVVKEAQNLMIDVEEYKSLTMMAMTMMMKLMEVVRVEMVVELAY